MDLVIILDVEGLEDGGEAGDVGAGEDAEGEVHHLETLGAELEVKVWGRVRMSKM